MTYLTTAWRVRALGLMLVFAIGTQLADAQKERALQGTPVLLKCTPDTATAGTLLELEGNRIGADRSHEVHVVFIQGGLRITSPSGSSSYWTNDVNTGLQKIGVNVPEGLTPGKCLVVVEVAGQATTPISIEIGNWTPPALDRVRPPIVQVGESISVYGSRFNISDKVELIDANGVRHTFELYTSAASVSFTLSGDVASGDARLRIVNPRGGDDQGSNELSVAIAEGPVPLDIWEDCLESVASGQWMNLVITTVNPLRASRRAEVEFRQGSHSVISPIIGIEAPRVRVPERLEAGDVELTTRTWSGDTPSSWSTPVSYKLLDRPAASVVEAIEVGDNNAVFLHPGPDKPESFNAAKGDKLVLSGSFPVASGNRMEVILESAASRISIKPNALEDRSAMEIKLPLNIKAGDWKLIIHSFDDGLFTAVPIVMHVE